MSTVSSTTCTTLILFQSAEHYKCSLAMTMGNNDNVGAVVYVCSDIARKRKSVKELHVARAGTKSAMCGSNRSEEALGAPQINTTCSAL